MSLRDHKIPRRLRRPLTIGLIVLALAIVAALVVPVLKGPPPCPPRQDNIGQALDTIHGHDYTCAQAAGMVANLVTEVGPALDPQVDSPVGYGVVQWSIDGQRYHNLVEFSSRTGQPMELLDTQLEFMVYELETDFPEVNRALKAARTPSEAASVIYSQFLMVHGTDLADRQQLAERLAG